MCRIHQSNVDGFSHRFALCLHGYTNPGVWGCTQSVLCVCVCGVPAIQSILTDVVCLIPDHAIQFLVQTAQCNIATNGIPCRVSLCSGVQLICNLRLSRLLRKSHLSAHLHARIQFYITANYIQSLLVCIEFISLGSINIEIVSKHFLIADSESTTDLLTKLFSLSICLTNVPMIVSSAVTLKTYFLNQRHNMTDHKLTFMYYYR